MEGAVSENTFPSETKLTSKFERRTVTVKLGTFSQNIKLNYPTQ